MRLVCPNCKAIYEVPDEVIPPEGRDVQCSACGHVWFAEGAEAAAEAGDTAPAEADDELAGAEAENELAGAEADAEVTEGGSGPQAGPAGQSRPALSSEVARILREEAERERRAREAERGAGGPESQAEMEMSPAADITPPRPGRGAEAGRQPAAAGAPPHADGDESDGQAATDRRRRLETLQGAAATAQDGPATAAAGAAAAPGPTAEGRIGRSEGVGARGRSGESGRDDGADQIDEPRGSGIFEELPDIDRFSASLDGGPQAQRDPAAPSPGMAEPRPVGGGFGRGFMLGLLVILVLLLIYLNAASLARSVPAIAPWLEGYVNAVDQGRDRLNRQTVEALQWLEPMPDADPPPGGPAGEAAGSAAPASTGY